MRNNKFWLNLILIMSVFFNTLPVSGQINGNPAKAIQMPEIKLKLADNSAEAFRGLLKSGNTVFRQILKEMANGDEDAANALEAQSIYFFEQFQTATKDQLAQVVEKAREFNKQKYESLKKGAPVKTNPKTARPISPKPAVTKKTPGIYGNRFVEFEGGESTVQNPSDVGFVSAKYSPNQPAKKSDAPEIKVIRNETGITSSADETNTIETENINATHASNVERKANFDGNAVTSEIIVTEKTDAVSKAENKKITEASKILMGATFEVCPDSQGIVRGKGKAQIYNQTTINTGKQLAALTSDYTIDFQITAYVNDDAEMTHFDMKGAVTEKMLGYDRALQLGMIGGTRGIADGTKGVFYQIDGSTPPTQTKDQYGYTTSVSPEIGKVSSKLFQIENNDEAKRITDAGRAGLQGFMTELEPLMRSSISRWQNYECVAVQCTEPKTSLQPNESVDVTAVSVSKKDLGKINAKLKGTGTENVTPATQKGTPRADFILTAPAKGEAEIVVESTSKRGKGIESLKIPVSQAPKKLPVKVRAKTQGTGWRGKIVYESRFDSTTQGTVPVYGVGQTTDSFSKIIEITMAGDGRAGTAKTEISGKHTDQSEARQKRCCRSGGLGRCAAETVQITKYQTVAVTSGSGTSEVTGFINVSGGKYSIEFTVPGVRTTIKTTKTSTFSGMCNPADNKTDTSEMTSEAELRTLLIKAFGEINAETPQLLKGQLQLDQNTRVFWELTRVSK